MNRKIQTYNDGIINIYEKKNIAEKGNTPKDGLMLRIGPLRFDELKVGITRHYAAKQANVEVSRVIRVPLFRNVKSHDIVHVTSELDGDDLTTVQYKVDQIQYPKEVKPDSMDLALERLEINYVISET